MVFVDVRRGTGCPCRGKGMSPAIDQLRCACHEQFVYAASSLLNWLDRRRAYRGTPTTVAALEAAGLNPAPARVGLRRAPRMYAVFRSLRTMRPCAQNEPPRAAAAAVLARSGSGAGASGGKFDSPAAALYIDLMKRCVCNIIYEDPLRAARAPTHTHPSALTRSRLSVLPGLRTTQRGLVR